MVIDWLKLASFAAVARQCRLSWDQVSGIQERAVRSGLSRHAVAARRRRSEVEETSFQRRHEYVTVVNDLTASEPRVMYVADGRAGVVLDGYLEAVGEAGCAQIAMVAMDMWPTYIGSVRDHTEALIVFDKFHVAQHLGVGGRSGSAVGEPCAAPTGDDRLVKTRYLWLTDASGNMTQRQHRAFTLLRRSSWRVVRAWAIKELAMRLWDYCSQGWVERMSRRRYGWAIRSQLEPIKEGGADD